MAPCPSHAHQPKLNQPEEIHGPEAQVFLNKATTKDEDGELPWSPQKKRDSVVLFFEMVSLC